jgi:hypothetical protein
VSSAVKGILVTPHEALAILLLVLLLGAIALTVAVVTILVLVMLFRFEVLPQGIIRAAGAQTIATSGIKGDVGIAPSLDSNARHRHS